MKSAKETLNENKSLNWDTVEKASQALMPGERLPGFPFNEGFPTMYVGQNYEIILVSGERFIARVDAAREFMSEGLEWKPVAGGANYERTVVAAWKKL